MAIAYYTQAGHAVAMPLTDGTRYDLIVDDGCRLRRVQVKTTGFQRSGRFEVCTKTSGGNRSWSGIAATISEVECESVFVYAMDGSMYEFPVAYVAGKKVLVLGKAAQAFRIHRDWLPAAA
jgi:hypothetical protein